MDETVPFPDRGPCPYPFVPPGTAWQLGRVVSVRAPGTPPQRSCCGGPCSLVRAAPLLQVADALLQLIQPALQLIDFVARVEEPRRKRPERIRQGDALHWRLVQPRPDFHLLLAAQHGQRD